MGLFQIVGSYMRAKVLSEAVALFVSCTVSAEDTQFINDRLYHSTIMDSAQQLYLSGEVTPVDTLIEQMFSEVTELALPRSGSTPMSGPELYRKHMGSVLTVGKLMNCELDDCSNPQISAATGFVIHSDGVVVTNFHVMSSLLGEDNPLPIRMPPINAAFAASYDGEVYPITDVLATSVENDLAILKIDTKGRQFQPIPLGHAGEVGEDVYILSNPSQNFAFFSKGIVARYFDSRRNGKPRLHVTADYAKGSSGGPLFDARGNLVGVVSLTHSIYYDQKNQKNLQMVLKESIPVASLRELITPPSGN